MSRALTHTGLAAVCAAAGILLPLAPTLGQPPDEAETATVRPEAPTPAGVPATPSAEVAPGAPAPVATSLTPTPADSSDEVNRLRAEVQRLNAELRAARRKLMEVRASGYRPDGADPRNKTSNFGPYAPLRRPPAVAMPGAAPMGDDPYGGPRPAPRAEGPDQRLDRLEQSLSRLLDEVRIMRQERRPDGPARPEAAPPPPPPYPDAPATPQLRRF